MSSRPWYKRYPSDFINGCLRLSLEEKGAYSMIVDLMFDTGGPLPNDDPKWIATVCTCSIRKWHSIRDALIAKGKIYVTEDGKISCPGVEKRLEKEAQEASDYRQAGSRGGRKSAENRAKTSDKSSINRLKIADKSLENEPISNGNNDLAENRLEKNSDKNSSILKPYPDSISDLGKDLHSSSSIVPPTRDAMLSIEQHADQISASAEVTAPKPLSIDRHLMPRANDKPFRWLGSGLARGSDGKPQIGLDDNGTQHLLAGRMGWNRVMLDDAALKICNSARIEPSWRGDWNTLVQWLDEGLHMEKHILPAIATLVERQVKSERGYRQPSTLRYFGSAIREYAAAHQDDAA
jgi:uncharacterized protein YdaU (DUF1376 family)